MSKVFSFFSVHRIAFALVTLAIAIVLYPIDRRELPTMQKPSTNNSDIRFPDTSKLTFANLFDGSSLPTPQKSVGKLPPNPFASIEGFQLIGVTLTDSKFIALVSDQSEQRLLTLGDSLGEFTVTNISAREILLEKDTLSTQLRLQN